MGALHRRFESRMYWHVKRPILDRVLRPTYDGPVDTYRFWRIPRGRLDASSVCFCAGVGEEIELERGLRRDTDAIVYALDPTPRAIAFIDRLGIDDDRFRFVPVGLWNEDTTLRFHAPHNPADVSHSIVTQQDSGSHFDAPCRTVRSLMTEYGLDRLDLLKMNIEGAEEAILKSIVADDILPGMIAVTFEGERPFRRALRWTKYFASRGYRHCGFSSWSMTYVREP